MSWVKNKSFSLIEILISIILLSLITSNFLEFLVITNLSPNNLQLVKNSFREKSYDNTFQTKIKNIEVQIDDRDFFIHTKIIKHVNKPIIEKLELL